MKPGHGKMKGASFERKICQQLSRLFHPELTLFWRSAMSGGRATVQHKRWQKGDTQSGDISCIDPLGAWLTKTYSIECKHHASLDFASSVIEGKGRLAQFWKQARSDAARVGKSPLLIARGNRMRTLILFEPVLGLGAWIKKFGGASVYPDGVWIADAFQLKATIFDYERFLQCQPKVKATIPRMVPASRR